MAVNMTRRKIKSPTRAMRDSDSSRKNCHKRPKNLQVISKPPLRPNLYVGSRRPILEIPPWRDYCGCPPRSAFRLCSKNYAGHVILHLIESYEMACNHSHLLQRYSWIQPFVNNIHGQINENKRKGQHQYSSLDHRIVLA